MNARAATSRFVFNLRCLIIATLSNFPSSSVTPTTLCSSASRMAILALHQRGRPEDFHKGQFGFGLAPHLRSDNPWYDEVA